MAGSANETGAADVLLQEAKKLLLEEGNLDAALERAQKALEQSGDDDVAALELLGEILVEADRPEQAQACLSEAISREQRSRSINPHGFAKYLLMAQINEAGGAESVQYFEQAIDMLSGLVTTDAARAPEYLHKLCVALCGIAELYMTDLCMEADAEEQCEAYVDKALKVNPDSVDALVTLASMRISQQRPEEARAALGKAVARWLDVPRPAPATPDAAVRFVIVRLLVELAEYETSIKVLQTLQMESEDVPDLWYLFGWTYYLQAQNSDEAVRLELLSDARDCLEQCMKLVKRLQWEDEGIIEHATELLATLNDDQALAAVQEESVDAKALDEEAEWLTDEDDVHMEQ